MSFTPKKHTHPVTPDGITQKMLNEAVRAMDEHQQALYDMFKNYSATDIQKMTAEEYGRLRHAMAEEQYYGYHQKNSYPGALRRRPEHDDRPEPFISARLETRITEWSRQDPRVEWYWRALTQRIRSGLTEQLVERILDVLSALLQQWDQERDRLNTRNVDNIRTLGESANFVVDAFEDAKARGDLEYMDAAIEELDSALHDVKYGEERG